MLTREFIFSDKGQNNLAEGYARPIRVDHITLSDSAKKKLLPSSEYTKARPVDALTWMDGAKKVPALWAGPRPGGNVAGSRGRRSTWLAVLWTLPFLVEVVLFDLLPMVSVVAGSVLDDDGWSLGKFTTVLSSRFYRAAFETSIGLSLLTSAIGPGHRLSPQPCALPPLHRGAAALPHPVQRRIEFRRPAAGARLHHFGRRKWRGDAAAAPFRAWWRSSTSIHFRGWPWCIATSRSPSPCLYCSRASACSRPIWQRRRR